MARGVLNKPGFELLGKQVYIRDLASGQLRRIDLVVQGPSGRIFAVEVKSGSASYGGMQRVFDRSLTAAGGTGFEAFGKQAATIDPLLRNPSAIQRVIVIEVP